MVISLQRCNDQSHRLNRFTAPAEFCWGRFVFNDQLRNKPMANQKRIRTEPRQKPVRPGTPLYRALEATARAVAAKLAERKTAGSSDRS
jgi:hypothetical protein